MLCLGLNCPIGNKTVPHDFIADLRTPNKFYRLTKLKRTFYHAKKVCNSFGADLPNLDTKAEFDVIVDYEGRLNMRTIYANEISVNFELL